MGETAASVLARSDGQLVLIREYMGAIYMISASGHLIRVHDPDVLKVICYLCPISRVGVATWDSGAQIWYLKPRELSEEEVLWADRVMGPTGDATIARLLLENE